MSERLTRLSCGGAEFIAEFSLLFPTPISVLADPHYNEVRRLALFIFGKSGTTLPQGGDVIEVPAQAGRIPADGLIDIKDGLPLVVDQFAIPGQTVCIPTLNDSGSAVVAALEAGCAVIAADDDQSLIDDVVREVSQLEGGDTPSRC